MKIFYIIPLDEKGCVSGETTFTDDEDKAKQAFDDGHSVAVTNVTGWYTAFIRKYDLYHGV